LTFDVVHVTPYYRPATVFGGPVASVSGLAEEQARRGMKVAVVTTDAAARRGSGAPWRGFRCPVSPIACRESR
jgi:hypothetical protein